MKKKTVLALVTFTMATTVFGLNALAAEVTLDQGVLVEGDATEITTVEDGSSFTVAYDEASYSGVLAYYLSSETYEKVYLEAGEDGSFAVPEEETVIGGKVYVEPVRNTVTVSLKETVPDGPGAGSDMYFMDVTGAVFNEEGLLTGYESAEPMEETSLEAANGDYIFFARDVLDGYQPKNNIAPHQMLYFNAVNADGEEKNAHGFFDYDFYAYDSAIDVSAEELIALEPTTEFSEAYAESYNSPLYTTNAEDCTYPQSVNLELYYIRIGTDVTCWEEREPVKINNLDTMRDLVLGMTCTQADVEIALDADTLQEDTVVTVIDTDNNNRDNMGNIEYKGYSTEDTYEGLEGKMYSNWAGETYAGDRNTGVPFTPGDWTTNESGAAQYRCGEGVQVSVSDPENYEGINVYYVDDNGEQIAVEVTDKPYTMYDTDGTTQYTPEQAEGTWYFTCPLVTLSEHLTLTVEFIGK